MDATTSRSIFRVSLLLIVPLLLLLLLLLLLPVDFSPSLQKWH
jgi:hypothetical protein